MDPNAVFGSLTLVGTHPPSGVSLLQGHSSFLQAAEVLYTQGFLELERQRWPGEEIMGAYLGVPGANFLSGSQFVDL